MKLNYLFMGSSMKQLGGFSKFGDSNLRKLDSEVFIYAGVLRLIRIKHNYLRELVCDEIS